MLRKNIWLLPLFFACFLAGCSPKGIYTVIEIPKDFKVVAITGGVAPGEMAFKLELDAQGQCVYFKRAEDYRAKEPFIEIERFKIEDAAVRSVYKAVKESDFFKLDKNYKDNDVLDGSFAILTITADGKTHTVRTQNIEVEGFDRIMRTVNMAVPGMNKVLYNAILK